VAAKATFRIRFRVAVVDDEADMHLLIRDILQCTRDFSCAGCFANATDALAGLPGLEPDLVLMDIRMPGVNGIECAARLKRTMPRVKTIMMTAVHDAGSIEKSSEAGADGYLTKPVTADQCLATLRFALKGRAVDCPPLSRQDNEVMRGLAAGLLYKEIADKMGISYSTVHKHQHRIFLKLRVSNRAEAIRNWRDAGGD
jgi:DNA-binding NarL/FixJ family response regulator